MKNLTMFLMYLILASITTILGIRTCSDRCPTKPGSTCVAHSESACYLVSNKALWQHCIYSSDKNFQVNIGSQEYPLRCPDRTPDDSHVFLMRAEDNQKWYNADDMSTHVLVANKPIHIVTLAPPITRTDCPKALSDDLVFACNGDDLCYYVKEGAQTAYCTYAEDPFAPMDTPVLVPEKSKPAETIKCPERLPGSTHILRAILHNVGWRVDDARVRIGFGYWNFIFSNKPIMDYNPRDAATS